MASRRLRVSRALLCWVVEQRASPSLSTPRCSSVRRLIMQPKTFDVNTRAGALKVHCWEGARGGGGNDAPMLTIVTVHPWAVLGGSEYNCIGISKCLAQGGRYRALTFNMRSSSMVWGVLSNHSAEVKQVQDVCAWASREFGSQLLLLGSSAGAPQAGSALDQCDEVVGAAMVGYTFGLLASVGFGRHFGAVLRSQKPRLFIMGDRDEFTSEQQLRSKMAKARSGSVCECVVYEGVGHFGEHAHTHKSAARRASASPSLLMNAHISCVLLAPSFFLLLTRRIRFSLVLRRARIARIRRGRRQGGRGVDREASSRFRVGLGGFVGCVKK